MLTAAGVRPSGVATIDGTRQPPHRRDARFRRAQALLDDFIAHLQRRLEVRPRVHCRLCGEHRRIRHQRGRIVGRRVSPRPDDVGQDLDRLAVASVALELRRVLHVRADPLDTRARELAGRSCPLVK
jgi:hypothetical protein